MNMVLKVIGSGLGRTGTVSAKVALEQLGFGPCHHMSEVFPRPDSVPLWVAAHEGRPDWEALFDGFSSMVDYPGSNYYRQLADYYPKAKVLHTTRDPDQWFDSTQETIFAPEGRALKPPPHMKAFFATISGRFGDHIHDRGYMTDYFRRHDAEVRNNISAERLLVFEASQGWRPLCDFLQVAIPDTPFPSLNSREAFKAKAVSQS